MATMPRIGTALHALAIMDLDIPVGITAEAAELNILDGATVDVDQLNMLAGLNNEDTLAAGAPVEHVEDVKADYTTGDLDNEAKTIAAVNATNAAVNAILAALIEFGIMDAE